jgi:hypothetical protein
MYGFHQAQLLSNMAIGIFTLRQQLRGLLSTNWPGAKTPYVEYLVVGGGGAGGYTPNSSGSGGGGGAGGVLTGILPVVAGATNNVTIGGGGTSTTTSSSNGVNSVLNSLIAVGGGVGGAGNTSNGGSGGSGGGGQWGTSTSGAGAGIAGQGNAGAVGGPINSAPYSGAGGGGAGTIGLTFPALNGGAGIASSISGTVSPYGGGGGGGSQTTAGTGGIGGGGAGGTGNTAGTAAQANTGGGGGGAGNSGVGSLAGGAGGSGIVIISYPDIYPALTTGGATSPTVSTSGSGSISFNGTNQGLIYTDSAGLALGAGDFTVECFVYPGSQAAANSTVIGGEASGAFQLTLTSSTGTPTGVAINAFGTAPFFSASFAFSQSVWYHIACTRSGTSVRVYVNGNQIGSTTSDVTNFSAGSRSIAAIAGNTSQRYAGNVSNIRLVKGTALYTGSTLTVPTAPLTAVTNTTFLLNSVSGAYLADSSANSLAVSTSYNSPLWNQLSPFATGLGYKNRVYTWAPTVAAGGTATGTFTV